ncbi:MAG: hypothetical protein HYV95_04135 [Opitutae bacterium]|nr:hypothetical protein [Opitutae bacterium]
MLCSASLSRTLVRVLVTGLLLLAGPRAGAASDWQSLLGNSPFGPAAGATNAPAAGELELRGVVEEDGVTFVNIFNPATKTAQWIEVNGEATGIRVSAYDSQTGRVTVTQGGRQLTLPFKQARISLLNVPLPAPVPPQVAGAPAQPAAGEQPPQANDGRAREFYRNLPPDARAMIEEFRRRRAAAAAERAQQQGAAGNNRRP